MLIGYGDYVLSFVMGGSAPGSTFTTPTDGSALADGRTGEVQGCQWIGGVQNTSAYVEITVTISSALDATARLGVIGIMNSSLPAGTKVVVQSITQRLVADSRGQRNAWFVPQTTGNSFTVRIYNDVNGVASIVALSEFSIGEIYVGRAISLCTLLDSPPNRALQDPTSTARTAGGQIRALMRKPYWQVGAKLGRFTQAQAKGGTLSNLPDGAGGTIDIQTLSLMLSTTQAFAICDTPSEGFGAGSMHGDIRFDQDFMQLNWMLARLSSAGQLQMDAKPLYSWAPQFQEAT